MAAVGSGVGLLAKKVVLPSLQGATAAGGGEWLQGQYPSQQQGAEGEAGAGGEVGAGGAGGGSELRAVLERLDALQGAADDNARDIAALAVRPPSRRPPCRCPCRNRRRAPQARVGALEKDGAALHGSAILSYPPPADFKQDILSGLTALLAQQARLGALAPRPALPSPSPCRSPERAPRSAAASPSAPPPPSPLPRTKWTRRVPHPVIIGHAASLTPY